MGLSARDLDAVVQCDLRGWRPRLAVVRAWVAINRDLQHLSLISKATKRWLARLNRVLFDGFRTTKPIADLYSLQLFLSEQTHYPYQAIVET